MQRTRFRTGIGTAIIGSVLCFNHSASAIVPVEDTTAHSKIGSVKSAVDSAKRAVDDAKEDIVGATKAVGDTINANQKILTNINQVLANVMVSNTKQAAQIQEMRRNADTYDRSMGAGAKPSCGTVDYAVIMEVAKENQKAFKKKAQDIGTQHIERMSFIEEGEDPDVSRATTAKQRRKVEAQLREAGIVVDVISNDGLPIESQEQSEDQSNSNPDDGLYAWPVLQNKMVEMAIPTPVEVSEDELNGVAISSGNEELAQKLIHLDRQKMINEVISQYVSERGRFYDSNWAKMLLEAQAESSGGQVNDIAELPEKMSQLESDIFINTFRLKSPKWITYTGGGANEVGLLRDQNLMLAQQLKVLNSIYLEQRQSKIMLTYLYANAIEQSGIPNSHAHERLKSEYPHAK